MEVTVLIQAVRFSDKDSQAFNRRYTTDRMKDPEPPSQTHAFCSDYAIQLGVHYAAIPQGGGLVAWWHGSDDCTSVFFNQA